MKGIGRLIGFSLLLGCFFLSVAWANDSADDDTASDNPHLMHLYGNINMISRVKYQYGKLRIFVKAVYPSFVDENAMDAGFDGSGETDDDHHRYVDLTDVPNDGGSPSIDHLNAMVWQHVADQIQTFGQEVSTNQADMTGLPKSIKNNLYIDYDAAVMRVGHNHIISIRFSLQAFVAGMAHPYHYYDVLNYDMQGNQAIDFSDLFKPDSHYLEFLADYSRKVLTGRLTDALLVESGTTPTAEHFRTWNLKPRGLLITFDQGQVAPYVEGAEAVLIPYPKLQSIVSPDSPIALCTTHPARCDRGAFLSGGFIDEAALPMKNTQQLAALTRHTTKF